MAFNGLRMEYALDGSSNYISWKDGMEVVLKDNGLKEFIENDVPKSVVTDATNIDACTTTFGGNSDTWFRRF